MLHLIWSKDNTSTSEDGKELKGIRSRLLECYRQLYFDPLPDLEPKQQVNRIAKNMIEWATLLRTDKYYILLTDRVQTHLRLLTRRTDQPGRDDEDHDGR